MANLPFITILSGRSSTGKTQYLHEVMRNKTALDPLRDTILNPPANFDELHSFLREKSKVQSMLFIDEFNGSDTAWICLLEILNQGNYGFSHVFIASQLLPPTNFFFKDNIEIHLLKHDPNYSGKSAIHQFYFKF